MRQSILGNPPKRKGYFVVKVREGFTIRLSEKRLANQPKIKIKSPILLIAGACQEAIETVKKNFFSLFE
jgi:hypothetical protein